MKAEKKEIERVCTSKDEEIKRFTKPHYRPNHAEQEKNDTGLNYHQTTSSNYDSKVRMVTDIKDLIT